MKVRKYQSHIGNIIRFRNQKYGRDLGMVAKEMLALYKPSLLKAAGRFKMWLNEMPKGKWKRSRRKALAFYTRTMVCLYGMYPTATASLKTAGVITDAACKVRLDTHFNEATTPKWRESITDVPPIM